jgi:RND family efflux transporter MFP subunit
MKISILMGGVLAGFTTVAVLAAELDARLEWSRRAELSMPVSGVVVDVAVNAGERVATGQALVSLDPGPFQTSVNEALARQARARIEREEATRDAKQAQELYDRTVLSTVELENARNKRARADAAYKEATAALDRARYQQRVSILRAPFDAQILSRRVEVGQTVSAELNPPTVMVIAAAGEYLAQARLAADRAASVKPGQEVQVSVGGKSHPAKIRAVIYDPASSKEPYVLEAVFSTSDRFTAGQAARIRLP